MNRKLLLILFFIPSILHAQEFGGNRFSTKWQQINSTLARIIFPKGLDSNAKNITRIIEAIHQRNNLPLGDKYSKINIVLQNQHVISNGYVGLGPYRSEFYMVSPSDAFDLGNVPWSELLTLHEYRHVQQYSNFRNGASKVMSYLFGQEGYALAINAAIPDWFFEGDAVSQETMLSRQGRGRMPSFLKAYPAIWESGKRYNWMKLRNGSYKDYVPNHYDLGYLLVSYGYEKYGTDFWRKVAGDASSYKGVFYPWQKAVKKHSGVAYKSFVENGLNNYKKLYGLNKVDKRQSIINENFITGRKRNLVNEVYPFRINKDSLLYMKSSYTQRPAFYIKDNSGEHLLRVRDISIDNQYSYRSGRIVYAAFESHPRWSWVNYSVIKILDLATGKQRTLQHHTRYFSPDISDDGKLVVANKVSLNGHSSLVVLDAHSGKVLKELSRDSIEYFSNPKIIDSNTIYAAVRSSNATAYIARINMADNSIILVTPASYNTLGQIDVKDNKIYFTASIALKDRILSADTLTHQLFELKTNGLTNYGINNNHGMLTWNRFTGDGYRMEQTDTTKGIWLPVSEKDFVSQRTGPRDTIVLHPQVYESTRIEKYPRQFHPFNFHSWRPNYDDPEFSFTVYGNNVLNTTLTQLYYLYNQNDRTHAVGGNWTYAGMFPHISLGSQYTFNRSTSRDHKLKQWNQWDNYVGVGIPLSWAGNRTYKSFNVGTNYVVRTDFNKGQYKDSFNTIRYSYLYHYISWAQQVQRAQQDIFPRWAYAFTVQYRHTIRMFNSQEVFAKASIYLPGFFPAHHVVFTAAAQRSYGRNNIFSNRMPFARGFTAVDSSKLWGITANYHFPIAYPDWGFANIFYILRLRGALFYDYTNASGNTTLPTIHLQSAGGELYFDTKWWNQYPLTFGFRGGVLLTKDIANPSRKFFFSFILPLSLIPK